MDLFGWDLYPQEPPTLTQQLKLVLVTGLFLFLIHWRNTH